MPRHTVPLTPLVQLELTAPKPAPPEAGRDTSRLGERLAASAALLWLTTLLLRGLQFITMTILARILDPRDYGVVVTAMIVVGFLDILTNIQAGDAVLRTERLTPDHLNTAFTLNLIRGLITATIMVLLARPLAHFMGDPQLPDILYVLIIASLASSLHNPHFLIYARNLDFRPDTKRDAVAAVLGSAASVTLALVMRDYWALVMGYVVTCVAWSGFTYWRPPGLPRLCLREYSQILSYGGWILAINILDYATSKVDYFLIGRNLGLRILGAYHIGQQVTGIAIGDIVIPLGKALYPAFSLLSAEPHKLRSGYRRIQAITLAIALPCGLGLSALSSNIILLLFGTKWIFAEPVLTFIGPLYALMTMTASIESLTLALNHGQLLFGRTVAGFIAGIIFMIAGFHYFGYMGLIYGRVLAGLCTLIYSLALADRLTGGTLFELWQASWRSFISAGLMWGTLILLPGPSINTPILLLCWMLAYKIIGGGIMYITIHLLLWHLSGMPEDSEFYLLRHVQKFIYQRK